MPATDLERLIVQLEADTNKIDKALAGLAGNVDKKLSDVERRTATMTQRVNDGFAKAGAAIASYFTAREVVAFLGRLSDAADKLQQLSIRTGASTDQLQKLDAAAAKSHISNGELNDSLDVLVRNLGQASAGQGRLAQVMRQEGISAGADLVSTVLNIADKVKQAKTRTEEYEITTAAFGRSSEELVGFLRQGSDAIKAQMDAFKDGLTPQAVKDLAEFSTHWQEIEVSFKNMAAGPSALVLRGLSNFLHDIQAGGVKAGLQDLASIYSFGMGPGRADTSVISDDVKKYRQLLADLNSLRKQQAAEQGPVMFPADKILRDDLTKQIAAKEAELNALAAQLAGRNVPVVPGTAPAVNKPFGAPATGNQQLADREIARTLAARKQAEADLAKATGDADKEALKDTEAFYDAERREIFASTDAAIESANEKANAEIAALDKARLGEKAYAESVDNIRKASADTQAALLEKRTAQLNQVDVDQLVQERAAAEALKQIDEQRAQTLQRTERDIATSNRSLTQATDQLNIELAKGTSAYFDAVRKAIEDDLAAQKAAIKEQEELEIDGLARLREQRFKSGEDGVSVWADYEQAVQNVQQKANNEILAADQHAAAQRHTLTEEETRDQQRQIEVMDKVRSGIEDIGVAALFGAKNFKQAVSDMLKQIAELIVRLYILKPLIEGTLGRTGTTGGFGFGDIFGSIFGIGGGASAGAAAADSGGLIAEGITLAAQGAVVGPKGKMPLQRYAYGGVARSPQVAIFGEGTNPEAFIPLSGGHVPVTLRVPRVPQAASAGTTVEQNFTIDARGAQQGVAEQIQAALVQVAPAIVAASVKQVDRNFPQMFLKARRDKL